MTNEQIALLLVMLADKVKNLAEEVEPLITEGMRASCYLRL